MIPSRTYKNAGWNGWADWLGKEKNANMPLSQRQLATSVISDDPNARKEVEGYLAGSPTVWPARCRAPLTDASLPVGEKVGERVLGLVQGSVRIRTNKSRERAAGQTRRAVHGEPRHGQGLCGKHGSFVS